MHDSVIPTVRPLFRALATTFVPEAASLDERGWAEAEQIVAEFLAGRPAGVRRQLTLLLRLLDFLPLLRWGRRFRSLDAAHREQFLAAMQDAPLLLLRRGVWGVRTLAFMAYYARPAAAAAIGYRADPRGWEAPGRAAPGPATPRRVAGS
ncbi:MAG TPA: hypothetical protein VMF70_09540 [Gemmatimonadales bacterium]|nr:hypothetical protein [Gemmatimonadales bacterium]